MQTVAAHVSQTVDGTKEITESKFFIPQVI